MNRYVGPVIVGVIVGVGSWFFGLPLLPSIVVGLVIAAAGVVLRTIVLPTDNREWPPTPPEPNDGTRHEVPELAWALRAPGGFVDDRIVERVRSLGARVLARRHLDVDDPAHRSRIEGLVGQPLYTVLASRSTQLSLPALMSALESLEKLEASDPAARD
jgi:hypothetical protein